MADMQEKSVLEDKTVSRHIKQEVDVRNHIGDPDYNVDSLGHVGATREAGEADHVTWKTWIVIVLIQLIGSKVLSSVFGLSFWPVPTVAAMQGPLAVKLGDPLAVYWFIPSYTISIAVGFLIAGANSDLFGRRLTLLVGEAGVIVGMILLASAKGVKQFQAGLGLAGFFGGLCQMALVSIPELMPNKYRHIGVTICDGFVFFTVIVGPVIGRYAIETANNWQYIFWGSLAATSISFVALFLLYHPPKHPKGVPWHEALRGADWVGAVLSAFGLVLTLMGIIYTTYKPSNDVHVIAPMVVGFALLVAFGFWEQFSKTKYKLCPPAIFVTHKGREFTVPFIVAFIVTMFYYGINIIYPTMINVFYTTPTTPRHETLLLTLPGNIGLVFGALLLIAFGNLATKFMPFKWTLIISFTGMVIWGGLLALVTPYNKGTMIAITFLEQTFFGWAQYSSISFTFFGVHQHDLGVAGGLAGMARYAGGSLATAIYLSILTNTQASRAAAAVPQAAMAAGLPAESAAKLLATFPLGAAALEALPGMTTKALVAASTAFQWSYAHGLKITALSTLSFGVLGIVMCCLCEDIDKKMTPKVEIFLENDVHADKNEFH